MNADRAFEAVRSSTLEVMPDLEPEAVTRAGTLADLGANSIDRAEIVTLAMERLGITVPVTDFQSVHDIPSLVELLRKHG